MLGEGIIKELAEIVHNIKSNFDIYWSFSTKDEDEDISGEVFILLTV